MEEKEAVRSEFQLLQSIALATLLCLCPIPLVNAQPMEMEQDKDGLLPVPSRELVTALERDRLLKANLPKLLRTKKDEIFKRFGRFNNGLLVEKNSPIMRYFIPKGNCNYLQIEFHFNHDVVDEISVRNTIIVEIH